MSKRSKRPKSTRKEGADAAQAGHARSANPYPASDTQKRDEWFAGYDAEATGTKRTKRPK